MGSELFPEDIKEFVHAHYVGCGPSEMAERINERFSMDYTKQQLKNYYANHHLSSGLTGYFEKGHVPVNKGKKGICACGCEKSWFRKGNIPTNHRQVGSERVTRDGYVEIKTAEPNVWKLKHRFVWEQKNGPIPKGMIVRFLDGNKENCSINNLELVSGAEHIEITRRDLHSNDPEISRVGIKIAKLNCQVRNRGKL